MGLVADMKRFRTAATPTISSKATCIIGTKRTAMTTAQSRWLDEEIIEGRLLTDPRRIANERAVRAAVQDE
ncbi:MAG: hypothetical protein WCA22_13045 [Candidatus Binatus sp.]